jgi:hypothetical protein
MKRTLRDYISNIPKAIKTTIAAGTLLGMVSFAPLPAVYAEEVYSQSIENSYKTEETNVVSGIVQTQGLEKKIGTNRELYDTLSNSSNEDTTNAKAIKKPEKKKNFTFFASGSYNLGLVNWAPCLPLEGEYHPGSAYVYSAQPYDLSYSFGIGIDYELLPDLLPNFKLFFDGNINTWNKLIAKKDGYGVGEWIFEQSGYEDARIGPFPMDTSYYMDTTDLRIGAKYYLPLGKNFQPWVGAGYGIYSWEATIGNKEEEKKYGQASGIAGSVSFLAGVDLVVDDFILRIFGDFGAPAVNLEIKDLFQSGWTFENTGGEDAVAPYRLGAAIGMKY